MSEKITTDVDTKEFQSVINYSDYVVPSGEVFGFGHHVEHNYLNVEVKILDNRLGTTIEFPKQATEHSAGLDLRACLEQDLVIEPGSTHLIPTGMAINIKNPNFAAVLLPRSGLGHKHGIVLGNLVGLIDSDYQGQVFVSLWNRSNVQYVVTVGERVAQMVFLHVISPVFAIVEEFEKTDRGDGGFGHTGNN